MRRERIKKKRCKSKRREEADKWREEKRRE